MSSPAPSSSIPEKIKDVIQTLRKSQDSERNSKKLITLYEEKIRQLEARIGHLETEHTELQKLFDGDWSMVAAQEDRPAVVPVPEQALNA